MSSAAKKLIGTTALEQAAEGPTDPETVLLLTGDGTDGAQNNTFLDSSSNNHTITRNGNVTQGTFTPFSKEEGKWGNYFDASGLRVNASSTITMTGDWTIESWVNAKAWFGYWFDFRLNGSWPIAFFASGAVLSYHGADGTPTNVSLGVSLNEWFHLAVVHSSDTTKIYVNGVLKGTTSDTTAYTNPSDLTFAQRYTNGSYFNGYISNFRIVSSAVYTAVQNFTPPTEPLTAITNTELLIMQSNRSVDNSGNNHTLSSGDDDPVISPFSPFAPSTAYDPATKGGSGYFDGSGDYLTAASDASFAFGTGDFTIEAWVYASSLKSAIIFTNSSGSGTANINFYTTSDGKLNANNLNTAQISSTGAISAGSWNHVAITKESGTYKFLINGASSGSHASLGTDNLTDNQCFVGARPTPTDFWDGYISNLRVLKGTALYTSDFTPPTGPVSEVSGTSLLCNFTNAGIIDSSSSNVIETVGNAQIDTTVVKYGTGSMEFDGAGDYLKVTPSSSFYFGTNDFTIECWINTTVRSSASGERRIFKLHGPASSAADQIQLLIDDNSGVIEFYSNTTVLTGTTAVDDGSWHHIALVRNSGTTTLFIDGSSEDSAADTTDYDVSTEPSPNIGSFNGTAGDFNGYIDDLRITKGLARYTTNFTPPGALI